MGLFSRKTDPVEEIDISGIDRSRPHPYLPHTDLAHRDHLSCQVCGQEPGDLLHIPMSEYKPQPKPQPEPVYGEIHWS
jgi:hypothetical protein